MRTRSVVIALVALNVLTLAYAVSAPDVPSMVRAAGLEIVDASGVVRAQLGIKLGAGDDGSGLVMGDGTEPTPIHLLARNKPASTHITLKGPGGRERVITPH